VPEEDGTLLLPLPPRLISMMASMSVSLSEDDRTPRRARRARSLALALAAA
jgi:hypothetical protein